MPLRVVIRGGGSIGRRHAAVLGRLGAQVQLWPVRPVGGPLDGCAEAAILGDAEGLAAYAGADLVVIATDTSRHVPDAVIALDNGCRRLLVEKPVAPTAPEVVPLGGHRSSGRVFVAAPLRAHRGFRELVIRLPAIGTPCAAYVHCQSWLPDWRPNRDYRESYSARRDEGGALRDLVHEIDYAAVLFGPPEAMSAALTRSGPLEMAAEQAATLLWQTATAAVALRLDYITRPPRRGVTVTGPDGWVSWNVLTATLRFAHAHGEVEELRFPEDLDRDRVMATQARALLDLDPGQSRDTLLASGAPATLAEGWDAVRICDDARGSDLARGG